MKNHINFLATLLRLNLHNAYSRKRAFWMQVLFMLLNNLTFFVFWWMLFQRVDNLHGYRLPDLAMIYGLSAGAWGLSVVVGGGRRQLAQQVADGALDTMLTQPKPLLPHVLLSQSFPSGIGDMLSAVVLWGFTGRGMGSDALMYLVAMVAGAGVFCAAGVIIHSLAFWLGPIAPMARQYEEFIIFFSVNPQNVIGVGIKMLLFTAIPSAFISYLPVEAIRTSNWSMLMLSVIAAVGFTALAQWVFSRGLRQYASGSVISFRL